MVTVDSDKSPKTKTETKLSEGMGGNVANNSSDGSDYETSLADKSPEMATSNGRSRNVDQSYGRVISGQEEDPGDLGHIDVVTPQLAKSEPQTEGDGLVSDAREAPDRLENGSDGFWILTTVAVLIVATGIGIALVLCHHDIEKTKLQNEKYKNELRQRLAQEKEYRLLEKEQKLRELEIKKVSLEIEAKKLENDRLAVRYKHEEEMVRLEHEKKKNETVLKVYEEQLTPRIVTRKKVSPGFFGVSTEYFEDVEVPYNGLPSNVKQIVAGTSSKQSWSKDKDYH